MLALAACGADPPSGVVGLTTSGCGTATSNGSGMLIEPGLALTSAHALRGGGEITVMTGDRTTTGTVVGFDPEMDLALVGLAEPIGRPLPLGDLDSTAEIGEGTVGVAYVVRDGAVVTLPVTVQRRGNIRTEDIYIEGETLRPGYELAAEIRSGDSGGAVVVAGEVIGVLWARSNRVEARAYAIDPIRADETIVRQRREGRLGRDIDLTRCT